jgi:hypothetical protein
VLLSVIVLGPAPLFEFFQVQLGRLASGEAFPAMTEEPRVMAANMSVHGLIWKLGVLAGAPSPLAARIVSAVFTVALLVGVAVAARRRPDRLGEAQLWLAVLFLGALCGPFSPEPYALLALLWLLTLLVPEALRDRRHTVVLAGAWLLSSMMVHILPLAPGPLLLALSLPGQLAGIAVAVWVMARAR